MAARGVNDVWEIARQIDPTGKPRKAGNGYLAVRCPAHEDRTPSLTVWYDTRGKLSFNCHAGCDHQKICDNLPPSVLEHARQTWGIGEHATVLPMPFRPTPTATPPADNIEAEYPYVTADGEPLYLVRRYPDKKIRQYHYTDQGLKPGRPDHLELVPYRLPDIIRAIRTDTPIWIVEGEKDADTLANLGLAATTNIGGAGKWTANLNHHFAGATVNIIGDNDEQGQAHAQTVRDHLRTITRTVRIIELPGLPPKGDITDWIEAGHTLQQLQELAEQADPDAGSLFGRFLDFAAGDLANLPQPRTILGPWFQQAGVNIVFGRGGTYKSFVVQSAAASMATGHPWGHNTVQEPQTVVYWAAEGRSGLHARFQAWTVHTGQQIEPRRLVVPERWPRLDDPTLGPFMAEELQRIGCTFLCIDTLNRTKGRLKENDSDDLGTTLFDTLTPIFGAGIGVAVVHHSGWNTGHTRGSSALFDNADQVYKIVRDGPHVQLFDEKGKDNAERPPLWFDLHETGGSLVITPREERPLTQAQKELVRLLAAHGDWVTTPQLVDDAGMEKQRIFDHLNPLVGTHVTKESSAGVPARWKTLQYGTQEEAEWTA